MIAAGVLGGLIVAGSVVAAVVWGMSTSSRVEDLESLAEHQGVELAATRTDLSTTQESLASTRGDLSSTQVSLSETRTDQAGVGGLGSAKRLAGRIAVPGREYVTSRLNQTCWFRHISKRKRRRYSVPFCLWRTSLEVL